jgi:hypothetical protein
VALTLTELRKWCLHDDIRFGRYNDRPGEALDAMRQLFRLKKLQDIAYRKIASMKRIDDVEVYLGYAVKLREPLGLSMVVPGMDFFGVSDITKEDLKAALITVQKAEDTDFYKELILDDTWNAFIQQNLGARYDQAKATLRERYDQLLEERIRAELVNLNLNPENPEVQRKIQPSLEPIVWHDMQYEVLEPLTRDFLTDAGVSLPSHPTN